MSLLEIKNLKIDFAAGRKWVSAVDGVSLVINPGEALCLIGESGAGKTVTALSIGRLLPEPPECQYEGQILVEGKDVLRMSDLEVRRMRGTVVTYVFQEPRMAFNPVFTVGAQVKDALKLHRPGAANDAEVVRLLTLVGVPDAAGRFRDYPRQFSGGMLQRAALARALACNAKLMIADEPTASLDVTIQAEILGLLRKLRKETGMSLLFITHNLTLVDELVDVDKVAVMYAGQIVESGPAQAVMKKPTHPYTKALLESIPAFSGRERRLKTIAGQAPSIGAMPTGCRFHPRCSMAQADCAQKQPELQAADENRIVRCPYWTIVNQEAPSFAKAIP